MKHIAIVALSCVLAVGVSAQQQAAPSLFDQAIAAEDQEHDLDKALRLYREAFEKAVADDSSDKLRISGRLYHLLHRLGRDDERKAFGERLATMGMSVRVYGGEDEGQDPERERELREKAQELLQEIVTDIGTDVWQQLLWIGRPAVPEIIVRIRDAHPQSYATLFALLWKLRGAQADAFLLQCATGKFAIPAAEQARYTDAIDVDSPLFRAYIENENQAVVRQMLLANDRALLARIAPEKLVELAERGSDAVRIIVLEWLAGRTVDLALLPRLHVLVRRGLAGTDPAWGKAAELFLCSTSSQRDLEGLQLLLGRLPELRGKQGGIGSLPQNWVGNGSGPSAEEVRELVPAIEACVARFPTKAAQLPNDSATVWLVQLMGAVIRAGDDDTVRKALGWWDKGFDVWWPALYGKVNASNAVEVFARRHLVAAEQLDNFIQLFGFDGPLPGELYEPIAAMVGEVQFNLLDNLASLLVRTGDERVVGWMLTQWEKDRTGERFITRTNDGTIMNSGVGDLEIHDLTQNLAWQMMLFAKSKGGEPVRDGMLRMLQGTGPRRPDMQIPARLLMALLTLGGEETLQCFATDSGQCDAVEVDYHPFLSRQTGKKQSPLQYLLSAAPQPPHGYTEQQVLEALQKLLQSRPNGVLFYPDQFDTRVMSARMLALFAANDPVTYNGLSWEQVALAELSRRLQDGEPCEALAQWFGERLAAHEGSDALLVPCYPNVVTRFHDQLVALLTSDSERWAYRAAQLLWTVDRRIDIAAALQNRHGLVREWAVEMVVAGEVEVPQAQLLPMLADSEENVREELARHFGAIVSKEAVPGLIGLLRDPVDSVRTAAADALTRIRFYHEQQAHWDRVLKGLDASPASACEKLLLQAKPGQPAAQRLLAIESLGTLGVPEALPFLIDWTSDQDDAVAKAARVAITAIHLDPRR